MKKIGKIFLLTLGALFAFAAFCLAAFFAFKFKAQAELRALSKEASDRKIIVVPGFHASLRHSWRGDAPDETGWGKDIRLIRHILKTLDDANARGLDARGTWDWTVRWCINEIVRRNAPDILENLQRRVKEGKDEIILGPWNNGLLNASLPDEFDASVTRAMHNAEGTGMGDLFGAFTPVMRPQEMMFSPSHIARYRRLGVEGIALYYSGVPFNSFSNFIEPLSEAERYNPLILADPGDKFQMTLIPAVSPGDVVNHGSLRLWLIDLRRKQLSGAIGSDVLLYINTDADGDNWDRLETPRGLGWLPNTGGLMEIIETVNQFDWAEFGSLKEYLEAHPPSKKIVVRQDLADGAFDGFASWAEKWDSQKVWTGIEASRMNQARIERALGLLGEAGKDLKARYDGLSKVWFERRLESLSTTHFGMASPLLNDERQEQAYEYGNSLEKETAEFLEETKGPLLTAFPAPPAPGAELRFVVYGYSGADGDEGLSGRALVSIPLNEAVADAADFSGKRTLYRGEKKAWPFAVLRPFDGKEGDRAIAFSDVFDRETARTYRLEEGMNPYKMAFGQMKASDAELTNGLIRIEFSKAGFPARVVGGGGREIGGPDFLRSGFTYRIGEKTIPVTVERLDLVEAFADGGPVAFVERKGFAELNREGKAYRAEVRLRWTLAAQDPNLRLDLEMKFPYTPKNDGAGGIGTSVVRGVDMNWLEAYPAELHPAVEGNKDDPIYIWRRDFMGETGSYPLNFPALWRSGGLTSLNNHATNGWAAVSDAKGGLLVAQSAGTWSSFAFLPMRVSVKEGLARASLNPFGAYAGPQWKYPELGGNGLGAELLERIAVQLRPPAPTFNGRTVRFSLLIAPFEGPEPPMEIQADARTFYHPPAVAMKGGEVKKSGTVKPAACSPPRSFRIRSAEDGFAAAWDDPETGGGPYLFQYRIKGKTEWRADETERRRMEARGLPKETVYEARVFLKGCEKVPALGEVETGEPAAGAVGEARKSVPANLMLRLFKASLADVFYRP